MPNYLAQVTLMPASNLFKDACVNTFSFAGADGDAAVDFADVLQARYEQFINSGWVSNLVRKDDHTIKVYDRGDVMPRAPIHDRTFDLAAAPTAAPLPPEVALCLSFQASPQSGISQARRRGRVYLGPLAAVAVHTNGRPTSGLMGAATAMGLALVQASDAAPNWEWCVWSGVTGSPYIVTNGWVDDEFDTQRRRGRLPTGRNVFTI